MSTITITCACGKILRAKAADAGKKCKCVGCGAVLTIPTEAARAPVAPVVAKPPVAKPTVAKRPTVAIKPAPAMPDEPKSDPQLDPAPLGDLLADLAIGPVDAPPVFELPMTPEPAVPTRSRPIALGKADKKAAPDVKETLAARSMLKQRQRPDAEGRGGSIHIDWKIPAFCLFALAIIGLVVFVRLGPMKARDEWAVAQEAGENVAQSVVAKAMQAYLAQSGGWTPGDSHYMPQVKTVAWFEPPFMVHMPDQMEVHGETSHGKFQGFFGTRTGELEADVDIFSTRIRVTGRIDKDGKVIAEIGGKVVEVPAIVQRDRQDLR